MKTLRELYATERRITLPLMGRAGRGLAYPPVNAAFPVQQLPLDERTPELAVVGPELAQHGVDVRLRQPFPRRERPHDFGQDEAAAALPSRPLDDPAVPPEGPQLPHLVVGGMPVGGGHDTL
jgi:hypothetical protein